MSRPTSLLTAAALTVAGVLAWRRLRPSLGSGPRTGDGVLDPAAVRDLYNGLAPVYDAVASAYDLVGAGRFHRRAVEALALRPGETAVDLACGTGVNLPHLVAAVGPTGRVVGVDLSPGMLDRARQRVEAGGWPNVELVEADVRDFAFPEPVHGVLSTYGMEMVPEHDAVIARAVAALAPGCRIAVGGLRRPAHWPEWAVRMGEIVNRPFGVTRVYEDVQPWRSVCVYAEEAQYDESLLGATYLAVGQAPERPLVPRES